MAHPATSRRGPLAAAVAALALLSALPPRYGQWVESLGRVARMVTAPVTGPIYHTARWLTPQDRAAGPEVAMLRGEVERWKAMYLQEQRRSEDFRRQSELLLKGSMYAELPVQQLVRPVIEASSLHGERLTVRAGSREGVEKNTVATTDAVQVVGRVSHVAARTCDITLITDPVAGQVRGVIMVSDDTAGPAAMLRPVRGAGILQGLVENSGPRPERGQIVRLDDDSWPRSARMLVLGIIDKVEKNDVGWSIITVKPTVDLLRVSEVFLRMTPSEPDAPGAPGGAHQGGGS